VVAGGSGAYVIGAQGEGFIGPGHCRQIVVGGQAGPVVGLTGSAQVGATVTTVYGGMGPPKSERDVGARKSEAPVD
jgi:hypothetical protein